MAIKRGTPGIRRVDARNYTQKQAQARLDETLPAFQRQIENALMVDAVEIDYYHVQNRIGIPCTCEKTAVEPIMVDERNSNMAPVVPMKDSDVQGNGFEFQDEDIFGDDLAEKMYNDDNDLIMDVSGDHTHTTLHEHGGDRESLTDGFGGGGSVNCGVCYRTGMQPPFKAYGKQRYLFTNYDVEAMDGYFVDTTKAPHSFRKAAPNAPGYVLFKTVVPKYFTTVTVSVRDNLLLVLDGKLLSPQDGKPLTADYIRRYAGQEMEFIIQVEEFTHVVLEFAMDVPPLYANISGEQMALDYERLTTISDITVILPPSLKAVEPGDILVVKNRNLVLKVRDKEVAQTATKGIIQWQVSTRVLQPTEPARSIANGFRMY